MNNITLPTPPIKRDLINRVKDLCRMPYTSYGCYPLVAITDDGALLCAKCVRENFPAVIDSMRTDTNDGWRVVAISHEAVSPEHTAELAGPDYVSHCANCNCEIGELGC